MLATIIIITICLAWLGHETEWLTLRLPVGKVKPKYARYQVYHIIRNRKAGPKDIKVYEGGNLPEDHNLNLSEIPCYQIVLSPGIEPMCGYEWLNKHCADMVDYQPKIEMNIANVRYKMTVKQPSVLAEVMKANKLTKQQKLALAV